MTTYNENTFWADLYYGGKDSVDEYGNIEPTNLIYELSKILNEYYESKRTSIDAYEMNIVLKTLKPDIIL